MCLRVFMIAVVVWLQPTTSAALECNIPHHKGAGILPFAVSPSGDVQLLLGFQKGRGWSSFGGGPKQVESINQPARRCESRKEAALREGVEELRFLIPRVEVKGRLDNARSFPVNVKPSEFKTFVIHIGLIDLAPYYSEPVLSRSGYTETSAIGWVSLRELVSLASFHP